MADRGRDLASLTTIEVEKVLGRLTEEGSGGRAATSTLFVPLGSTEQHGPHLPLSTDSIIAEHWAAELAATEPDRWHVGPTLHYGASGEHQSFPGTLSIGTAALQLVLVELARSARGHFGRIVFVSGHAGNAEALEAAVTQLRREGHDAHRLLPILPGSDAHAGRTETSLLLHLAPHLVSPESAEVGNTAPVSELMADMTAGGVVAVSPNGVLGDPTGASAEEGERLIAQLVEHGRAQIPLA